MRFWNVTRYNIPTSFLDALFFSNNFNSSAATWCCWFHDIHMLKVVDFTVYLPPFIVFRKDVCCGCDVKRLSVETSHSLNVSPHLIFSADTPWACKMIDFLVAVKIFYSSLFKKTRPANIPIRVLNVFESSHFQRVDYAVICMCCFRYFEA